jgi:hypothetical protein
VRPGCTFHVVRDPGAQAAQTECAADIQAGAGGKGDDTQAADPDAA